jgi:hypothetical protein
VSAYRAPFAEEPSLLERGWRVLVMLFVGSLAGATALAYFGTWLQTRYPQPMQTYAQANACPAPTMDESLVIVVRLAEGGQVVTQCLPVTSQGGYLSERRP